MYLIINSELSSTPEHTVPLLSEGSALLNLLVCLDYDPANPPLGDLLKKMEQLEGNWFILSPIHWEATHNDALIVATGNELEVHEEESKLWFDLFAEYLAPEQIKLHYYDAQTWLINVPEGHTLNAKPVNRLLNKSIMPELAQLDPTLFWQKFITESQMLFASKPNVTVMNGLWPWGNAPLGAKKEKVVCADAAFLPFAKQCSNKVTGYSPSIKLKKCDILLINDFSLLSAAHQEELKKLSVKWYWNNRAYFYTTKWYIRLWRTLTHAN